MIDGEGGLLHGGPEVIRAQQEGKEFVEKVKAELNQSTASDAETDIAVQVSDLGGVMAYIDLDYSEGEQ